jgi:hypothetical protein
MRSTYGCVKLCWAPHHSRQVGALPDKFQDQMVPEAVADRGDVAVSDRGCASSTSKPARAKARVRSGSCHSSSSRAIMRFRSVTGTPPP